MSSKFLYYPIQIREALVQVTFEATNLIYCTILHIHMSTYEIPVDHKKIVLSWCFSGNRKIAGQLCHESHSAQKHQLLAPRLVC